MAKPLYDIEPLRPILAQRPFGLFSDIDGTLSPIAPTPQEAYIPEPISQQLRRLTAAGFLVALISGRPLGEAMAMVGLEDVVYAGNHGFELWIDGRQETAPGCQEYYEKAREVIGDMSALAHPGVWVQDKGPVIAIHYRLAPNVSAAREAILATIKASAAARAFRLEEGKRIFELRPPIAVDKGTALKALVERFGIKGLLCLGDDTTDVDMFNAAHSLKADIVRARIAVGGAGTFSEVLATADYSVWGVEGVEWLLREIVRVLLD